LTLTLIVIGLFLALLGLVGCILPVVPGPPISYAALLLLSIAKGWEPFSPLFLTVMGGLTALVTLLDYVLPTMGARQAGASRFGTWGAVIGTVLGIFVFPPWGIFLGAFAGALAGEMLNGQNRRNALRSAWGVFWGTMVGIGFKVALCGLMLFFYIKELF